jgi:hypothetical protein
MVQVVVHFVVFSFKDELFLDGLLHLLIKHFFLVGHISQGGDGDILLDGQLVVLRFSNQGFLLLSLINFRIFSFAFTFVSKISLFDNEFLLVFDGFDLSFKFFSLFLVLIIFLRGEVLSLLDSTVLDSDIHLEFFVLSFEFLALSLESDDSVIF